MDGVHDKPGRVSSLSHFGQLVNIQWLDGIDSLLSSSEIRQRYCQIPIRFFLFLLDLILLIDTVGLHNGDLVSLLLGFLVLNFEFLEEFVHLVGLLFQFGLLFSQVHLEFLNTLGSFVELFQTLSDVLILFVNAVILHLVDILVEVNES